MKDGAKLLSNFIAYISSEKGLSKNTALSYRSDLSKFITWISKNQKEIETLTHQDITDFLWHLKSELNFEPRSIYRYTESIRQFYKFLCGEDLITVNPAEFITPAKIPGDLPKMLTEEEVEKLLSSIDKPDIQNVRNRAMTELLYACGIRVSELINLKFSDINLKDNFIRIFGKGNKERIVPLGGTAKICLQKYLSMRKQHIDINENVFLTRLGKKISRIEFWRQLKAAAKEAGITKYITPHVLRHSFASHLIARGADIRFVQELLGHSSIVSTQIYTHISNSQIAQKHQKYHPRG